jgi:hypothetical protein
LGAAGFLDDLISEISGIGGIKSGSGPSSGSLTGLDRGLAAAGAGVADEGDVDGWTAASTGAAATGGGAGPIVSGSTAVPLGSLAPIAAAGAAARGDVAGEATNPGAGVADGSNPAEAACGAVAESALTAGPPVLAIAAGAADAAGPAVALGGCAGDCDPREDNPAGAPEPPLRASALDGSVAELGPLVAAGRAATDTGVRPDQCGSLGLLIAD